MTLNPHQHPLLYLDFVSFDHLLAIIKFIYTGETEVNEEDLEDFLKVGRKLQIEGLKGENPKEEIGQNGIKEDQEFLIYQPMESSSEETQNEPFFGLESEHLKYSEYLEDIKPSFGNKEDLWKLPLPLRGKEDGKYPCAQCNYKTQNAYNFKKHRLNIHLGVRYSCDSCERVYTDSSALSKHKRAAHA